MLLATHRVQREHMKAQDTNRSLKARLTETTRAFEALEGDWSDLYENAPGSTPFQSFAWLLPWWRAYGENDASLTLKLIEVREPESGLLVGLLPLMVERAAPSLKVLKLLGSGITDYGDVLVREGWEREVFEVGADAVLALSGWNVGDFRQLGIKKSRTING